MILFSEKKYKLIESFAHKISTSDEHFLRIQVVDQEWAKKKGLI